MRQKLMQYLTGTEGATETHAIPHQDRGCEGNSCKISPGQTETLDLKWNYKETRRVRGRKGVTSIVRLSSTGKGGRVHV